MADEQEFTRLARVTALLVCGTLSSLLSKLMYQTEGPDLEGHWKPFHKPWASTAIMFVSMALCLPMAPFQRWLERRRAAAKPALGDPLLQPLHPKPETHDAPTRGPNMRERLHAMSYIAIPTFFDLIATTLMNVGLLYVTASVYQMLRGTQMVFAAVLVGFFLHRRLNKYQTRGLVLAIAGITLVGASSILSSMQSEGAQSLPVAKVLSGMGLIVLSQAVQAGQTTVEDYFMSKVGLSALHIVAYEGLLGCITMFGIFLPIVQYLPGEEGNGIHEDSIESWHMLMHSRQVQVVVGVQLLVLAAYNISGMLVTDELGAVTRSVVENARTLFVWLADLVLFYMSHGKFGEAWDRFSWIQLVGFAIMTVGTTIYGKGDAVETHDAEGLEEETPEGTTVGEGTYTTLKPTLQIHSIVHLRRRLKNVAARMQVHVEEGLEYVGDAVSNGADAIGNAAQRIV